MTQPKTFTEQQITTAINKAANDVIEVVAWDERLTDLMNLMVNVSLHYLEHPQASMDEAVEENYSEPYDKVLGRIDP